MKSITFTEFRKNASSVISDVENGKVIQLIRHGKPIAEISPILKEETHIPSWKKPRLKLAVRGEGLSRAIMQEREVS